MTVLVVGGGITGLTTAYELGQAGIPTMVVEASDRLGGKVRTEMPDGFLVESGPDSFVSYRPAALELLCELGLGHAILRPTEPRVVHVRAHDRFLRLPDEMGLVLPTRLRPFATTGMFSVLEKLRMGLDLVLPRDGLERDVGVGVFLRRRLGDALVERLAEPLFGAIYGTPIDDLSLLAVVPQLRDAERHHRSLLLASLASGRTRKPGEGGSPFVTLAGGIEQLVEALVGELDRSVDVSVRTGATAIGLERRGGRFDVRLAGGEILRPEAVILASPGPVTARLLDHVAPAAAAHVRTIPHGSTAVVSLAYRADQFADQLEGHGFLVAGTEPLSIDACTFSSLKWTGRAPDGMILLRASVGSRGERLLSGPEAEIAAAAHRDLASTLGISGGPALTRVALWLGAMPHYTVGHLDRVTSAFSSLAGTPDLILAGAAYRGLGIPDCIADGRAAAARVRDLLGGSTPDAAEPSALRQRRAAASS